MRHTKHAVIGNESMTGWCEAVGREAESLFSVGSELPSNHLLWDALDRVRY